MLWLLPALVLLGALAAPPGTATTCPACSFPGTCRQADCPPAQDACLFRQMQLENEIFIKNGSCVAPQECREGVYALTYAPNSVLSAACCEDNCSMVATPGGAPPNGVKCHYCSGSGPAPCDSLSVLSCTGPQTVCVTLQGTWTRGGPPVLRGCATPALCRLPAGSTLGPEAFGFRLTTPPACSSEDATTSPVSQASPTHSEAKAATTCFTCSDSGRCRPLPCPAERSHCLQAAGVLALGDGASVSWRNGSCVAAEDCRPDRPVSAMTLGPGLGFWVNATCCQGSCQEPAPPAPPAARPPSRFLCPTCAAGPPGRCDPSLYVQCPRGQTACVQLHLESEEGGRNLSVRGCGSPDLCGAPDGTEGLRALPGLRLAGPPDCSSRSRAVLAYTCPSGSGSGSGSRSGAARGPRLALPALGALLALAARALA